MRRIAMFAGLLALLGPLLDGQLVAPVALAALAAAGALLAVTVVAQAVGRPRLAAPHLIRARALRSRAARTVFLPQRDPDARGRTRPRAPGTGRAAA